MATELPPYQIPPPAWGQKDKIRAYRKAHNRCMLLHADATIQFKVLRALTYYRTPTQTFRLAGRARSGVKSGMRVYLEIPNPATALPDTARVREILLPVFDPDPAPDQAPDQEQYPPPPLTGPTPQDIQHAN